MKVRTMKDKRLYPRKLILIGLLLVLGIFGTLASAAVPSEINQWRNIENKWVTGSINEQNSLYYEGDSVPYRYELAGLQGDTWIYLNISYEYTKAGIHAFDFPTSYDRTSAPLLTVQEKKTAIAESEIIYDALAIPDDPVHTFDNLLKTNEGQQFITLGGDWAAVEVIHPATPYFFEGDPLGSSDRGFTIRVKTKPASTVVGRDIQIIVGWGGHLAIGTDNWGTGMGSGSIQGAPYHQRVTGYIDANNNGIKDGGESLGGGDVQIQGGAIKVIPPTLKLVKQVNGGSLTAGCWTLTATGISGTFFDSGDSTTFHTVTGGVQYTLSESPNPGPGYHTTGIWSCDGGNFATPNKITLADGQSVTCNITNIVNPTPTVVTHVHNTTHADITYTAVALGTIVHDNATLTGGSTSPTPTGDITYSFYNDEDCLDDPVSTQTVSLGTESSATSALAAGSYGYVASYSGDANNNAATGVCEPFTVNKIPLEISTTIKNAADNQPITDDSVPLGNSVYDNATVTGAVQGFNIGAITYTWRTNNACEGVGTSAGSGVGSVTEGPLGAGSYSFQATVAENDNYIGNTSDCEPLTVDKGTLVLATIIMNTTGPVTGSIPVGSVVWDTSTLTGKIDDIVPMGTVTYVFDANVGEIMNVVAGVPQDSSSTAPLTAGDHAYNASYSGDANYTAATAVREPLTVFSPPTGCTGTLGYWQHHICVMKLPVTLGSGGGKSTIVSTPDQAVKILSKDQCNGPSNAITGLDAQMLATKLAIDQIDPANNAFVPPEVATALAAADTFRWQYNCTDWQGLTNKQKQQAPWNQVNGWANIFDKFNNGMTEGWPPECPTSKCPSI